MEAAGHGTSHGTSKEMGVVAVEALVIKGKPVIIMLYEGSEPGLAYCPGTGGG